MALGVAATPSQGYGGPMSSRLPAPLAQTYQAGQAVTVQPSYMGPTGSYGGQPSYSGSFGGGTHRLSGSALTPAHPVNTPMMVRRMSSQNSAASFSMQPPIMTSQSPTATVVTAVPAQMTSRGLPTQVSYSPMIVGSQVIDGIGSVGGAADVMTAEEQERVLLQARLRRQSGTEELLQAELESMRRSAAAQEDRILQVTRMLQVSRENEHKLAADLEASRSETIRVAEELRAERLAREQAEAALTELRLAADMTSQAANSRDKMGWQSTATRSGSASAGRRQPNVDRSSARGRDSNDVRSPTPQHPPQPSTPNSNMGRAIPAPDTGRRASARLPSGKDETDGRLLEFLDREDCGILFRRLNRNWYTFRRRDERGPPSSSDRSVEISIVNGKLMARLEPSTHDSGWNNGKLGTIERFCLSMSA